MLGAWENDEVVEALCAALLDDDAEVRAAAAQSLSELKASSRTSASVSVSACKAGSNGWAKRSSRRPRSTERRTNGSGRAAQRLST